MSGPPARPRLQPRGPRAHEIARLAALLLLFLAAPTAGDIGSCGESPADLDAVKFFRAKEFIDCGMCFECGMVTLACERACDPNPNQTAFPLGCYPLVHDGEVCLNALGASGCDEYRGFMADQGATVPTECNFCPPKPSSNATDAGTDGAAEAGQAPGGG
ncbi:MAG TPA: hypothetical protein VE093_44015 [Polyangiaceae bacterium]|nr:hypothetical protein [Polyangiaceae bacterium]